MKEKGYTHVLGDENGVSNGLRYEKRGIRTTCESTNME